MSEIDERANKIQDNVHKLIEAARKDPNNKSTYQDMTNILIFRKLAELELIFEKIERIVH